MEKTKPIMGISTNRALSVKQREAMRDALREASDKTGYYVVMVEDGGITFDSTAELLAEQRITNNLLRELLQSNAALIEALGEPEQQQEPQYDMDGNSRAVAASQSAHLDMP